MGVWLGDEGGLMGEVSVGTKFELYSPSLFKV